MHAVICKGLKDPNQAQAGILNWSDQAAQSPERTCNLQYQYFEIDLVPMASCKLVIISKQGDVVHSREA